MAIDWAAEGLLDGLEGEARAARESLLGELADRGLDLEAIRRASDQGELVFTLAGVEIGVQPQYTWDEMLERAGASPDLADRLARANGFPRADPGERWYTDADVAALRTTAGFLDAGVPEAHVMSLARIFGRTMGQASELMRRIVLEMALEPGLDEHAFAVRYAKLAGQFTPAVEPLLGHLLRQHLRQITYAEVISSEERVAGTAPAGRPVTVAFADLVGFTRLGEDVPPEDLGEVAERLEHLVSEVITPPVRLVKTIGDAAMIVGPEPEPVLATTLALVEAADAQGDDFPQLRAGLAAGEAVSRAGDWFGRPVNLASRITGIARPGSVLTTAEVQEAVAGDYRWSKAGVRTIKGVPDPVPLWRARRAEDDGGD